MNVGSVFRCPQAALDKVQRLEIELDQCVHELRVVDSNASESVLRHPAFRKMRAMVVGKLVRYCSFEVSDSVFTDQCT